MYKYDLKYVEYMRLNHLLYLLILLPEETFWMPD